MQLNTETCYSPQPYWPKSSTFVHTDLPIVSCIMPTADRQEFIPRALKYFLDQDYPFKELIIIDDGKTPILPLLPNLYSVRYFYLNTSHVIGAKRNIACGKAAGSIIIHWDDDDWYAPNWISYQVNTLLNSEADICGLSHVQFYSRKENRLYFTKNINAKKHWLAGATLAYQKKFWNKHPFKNIQIGEDDFFIRSTKAKVIAHDYHKGFLAIIHSKNIRLKEY